MLVFSIGIFPGNSQELMCNVEINTSLIEGTNKSVFETLQQSISDYFNETKWTNMIFSTNEKIECKFFLTINEYYGDRMKGDLQVQLSRPVFNSNYTTTLLNFKDSKIEFDYREGEPLIFNENTWTNNLTGILDFYAYLFLALDFDSFSPKGGQIFYDKAATVVQRAQSSGETGWKPFEDNKNRSAVLSAFSDNRNSEIRNLLYQYHRKGLDEMVASPEKGRSIITESLLSLKTINEYSPMSVGLSIFRDSKLDELVSLYSKAPLSEKEKAYQILETIYPTEKIRLDRIKKQNKHLSLL